jgi:hypothetical protein
MGDSAPIYDDKATIRAELDLAAADWRGTTPTTSSGGTSRLRSLSTLTASRTP